ncbi:lysylphosphatidylglycerol synthase domain-containing protein [Pseudonocardia adelaidensis]|uniref:lysylphosphatidylglycerol synthase domain-containing protein n=1 Tax=Pseudonocardia adelaidensis TaxID=648754 RepID=UPI0031E95D19
MTERPTGPPVERERPSGSVGRHPRDLVMLLVAVSVVVLCSLAQRAGAVNPVELAIFEQFQQIPAASTPVWRALALAGSWGGIAVVSASVLYLKRIRLGLQCAGAGLAGLGAAALMDRLLGGRGVPAELIAATGVRLPGPEGFAFPGLHATVVAAMVALLAPYLRKPDYRGAAWAVAALTACADVYLGHSLPLDAFAGSFLGWAVGAAFHLLWGAPGRRTSESLVRRALLRAGLTPTRIVPIRERLGAPREFEVTTDAGDLLRVEVIGRLHRRGRAWYRLRRLLASVEVEDEPRLSTPYHEAEHEALVTLFAQNAGLRTPPIVLTCETRHGAPLLVRRRIEGLRLTQLPREEIDDRLLDAVWRQVAALGDARIAHHDLRAKNILVDTDGNPWLLNFTFGIVGATAARAAEDIAEALVSIASRVGVERAVRSACRVLPADRLEAALVYLQPLALPRRIRKQLSRGRYPLIDLRETLAEQIGRPLPTFRSPLRPGTVVGLLLLGAAVYTLLPQLSSMREVADSLRNAHWGWLAAATVTGFGAIVLASVSILGSSPTRLPFWRTTAVQFAAAFTGRTTPGGIGFFGINVAFMERLGIRRSSALGVTMLNMVATSVVGAIWSVIGVFAIGAGVLPGAHVLPGRSLLVGGVCVLAAAVAVLASPFGRRRIVGPGLRVARELLGVLRQPRRAVELFGGVTAYLVVSGLGLAASLVAFGASVPVLTAITVFVIGQTLGHIAPIPGGLGPTEALMVAGLTAMGTAPTVAVAAVLASRLLTYWLPAVTGVAVFRYLQHHEVV